MVAIASAISTAGRTSTALAATEPAVWKIRLALPVVSGFNRLFRDEPPSSAEVQPFEVDTFEANLIGLSVARQWHDRWTAEVHASFVVEGLLIREVLGLRGGHHFSLRDGRNDLGRGGVLLLTPLVGVAYRTRGNDVWHDAPDRGQSSIALTSTIGLDYTYFSSTRWGWTVRIRMDGALVVRQAGPSVWRNADGPTFADGYRGHVGVGIDAGVAF